MVDVFDKTLKGVSFMEMPLKEGDALIIKFDTDIWDIDEIDQMMKMFQDIFPRNTIVCTFNGVDIEGVLHK